MGVGYTLVNYTAKEQVLFAHVPASTARELAGQPAAAAITTWYLLTHGNHRVAFVSDTYDDWPFPGGSRADLAHYPDVTSVVIEELVHAGILKNRGVAWADEDEPETVYELDLRNCWADDVGS